MYRTYCESVIKLPQSSLSDTLLQIRVPEKYSVSGQVWYRGLPEFVHYDGHRASVAPAAE